MDQHKPKNWNKLHGTTFISSTTYLNTCTWVGYFLIVSDNSGENKGKWNKSFSFIRFLLSKCSIDDIILRNCSEYSFLRYCVSKKSNSLSLKDESFLLESSFPSTPSILASITPKLQTKRPFIYSSLSSNSWCLLFRRM